MFFENRMQNYLKSLIEIAEVVVAPREQIS